MHLCDNSFSSLLKHQYLPKFTILSTHLHPFQRQRLVLKFKHSFIPLCNFTNSLTKASVTSLAIMTDCIHTNTEISHKCIKIVANSSSWILKRSDLSTKLVESIVDEELSTARQISVSIGSADAIEYNARRRSYMASLLVVILCLVNSDNSLKCHQHQNDDVILSQQTITDAGPCCIQHIYSSFYKVQQLRTVCWSSTFDTRSTRVTVFIVSRLDYCNALLYGVTAYVLLTYCRNILGHQLFERLTRQL